MQNKGVIQYFDDLEKAGKKGEASLEGIQNAYMNSRTAGQKFADGLKNVGRTAVGIAGNMAIYAAVGYAIQGVVTALDHYINAQQKANEKAIESKTKYEQTKTELNDLKSQYEANKNSITELQKLRSAGTITSAQSSELSNLQKINAELQNQIQYKSKLAEIEGKVAADAAENALTYSKPTIGKSFDHSPNNPHVGSFGNPGLDNSQYAQTNPDYLTTVSDQIDEYNNKSSELLKIQNELQSLSKKDKLSSSEENRFKALTADAESAEKELAVLGQTLSKDMTGIKEMSESLYYTDAKGDKQLYTGKEEVAKRVEKINDAYAKAIFDSDEYKDYELNNILSKNNLSEVQTSLSDMAKAGTLSVDSITGKFPELQNAIKGTSVSLQDVVDHFNMLENSSSTNGPVDWVGKMASSVSSAISQIDNLNAAMVNSVSGKGLGFEIDEETGTLSGDLVNIMAAYDGLEGYDPSVLFEKTANGIHLNIDALRNLQAQEEANKKSDFLETRKKLQDELNNAIEKQSQLNPESADYSAAQSNIDSLSNQLETVNSLAAAYDGATSSYQKWLNAQSGGEEGDMYRSVTGTMIERGDELYKKELFNNNEFRAIADFFSYEDLSTASAEQVAEAYQAAAPQVKKFFTEGREGVDSFVSSMKELSDKEGLGWVEDLGDGNLKFNTGNDEEIAKRLGISKEAVQSIYRMMSEYTDGIQIGDTSGVENYSEKLQQLTDKAKESQEALKSMSENSSLKSAVDFDIDNMNTVDELESKISEINNARADLDVNSSQYQQAQDVIDTCQAKIDAINGTSAILDFEVEGQNPEDLQNKLEELENYRLTLNADSSRYDETNAKIREIHKGLDELNNTSATANVETNVQDGYSLISQFQQRLSELQNNDPNVTVNVNTAGDDVLDTIASQIAALPKETLISLGFTVAGDGITPSEIKSQLAAGGVTIPVEYQKSGNVQGDAETKEGNVDYKANFLPATPPELSGTVNYSGNFSGISAPTIYGTAVYTKSLIGPANGTAHAAGSVRDLKTNYLMSKGYNAYASGDWGLKSNELALVNELGTESIVRNGRFQLIPGGAHLENFKQGDIIFNHKQTAELLRNGFVTSNGGHGKLAYANGTAYNMLNYLSLPAHSAGTFKSGGSSTKSGGKSSNKKSSSKSSSSSSATKKNTAAVNKNTKATDDNTKTFDHIETLVDRITSALDSLERQAKDLQNTYATQNPLLVKAISQAQSNMSTLQKSADYYFNKANSVGISESYKNKLRNGQISIEDIKDENLAEKMEDFQKWYELGLKMKDEMEELKVKIKELNMQKLDNIKDSFSAAVDYYDAVSDVFQNSIDLAEAQGKLGKESDYVNMINQNNQARAMLKGEYNSLTQQLNELIKNGTIKKYTNDWYEWQSTLEEIRGDIIDIDKTIIELRQDILEVRWDNFNKSITKIDNMKDSLSSLSDLIEDTMVYVEDTSKISGMGYGKLALLQSELIQAKQAVANYGMAIDKLQEEYQKGFYSQEQYEEKLADLRKSQLDYVGDIKKAKDAILDLVKDGIERETDAMEKLIDKRKEALRKQKEAYDWNKKVTDYNKDRAKLAAQISAMSGDNTKETIAKRKKLEQELRELDEDFAEERKDHEFDTIEDAYDEQMDKFKELQEKQLNLIESSLEAQKEVIGTVLESVVNNHGSAYDALEQLSKEYGFKLSSDLTNPFKDALSALEEFKKAMGDLSANTDINIGNLPGSKDDVQSSTQNWIDNALAKSAGGSWKKNNKGWWYQNADGSWPKNDWMLGQDNKWYHFDDEGYMETGWKKIKDKWYHMNGSGSMDSGWQMVGGKWYYLGGANDGSMKTGWQKLDNKWYYMDSSGAMKSGWFNDGKGWYHTDKSGAMEVNKWLKSGQDWYYIGSSGKMYENQWLKDKNNWYYMNQSGAMSKGWQKVGNTWYYLGNDGIMQSSKWLKSGNDWYYLDKSGAMSTSKWIDNKYFVDHTGAMATNAYVKGYDGMYYWVNAKGEWEPKWNTKTPDLKKYKLAYKSGTKSSSEGLALTDEEGIGSEMFISPKGVVRDLPFGTMVFNKGQKEALWNLSKMLSSPDLSSVGFAGNVDSGLGVDIHIDNMVGNIEHIDKNALPSLERILEQSCDYTTKKLKRELGKIGIR
ncbi:hypothetical protein GKG47_21010 [Lactonifactor sp. BIOML-A3]|uniref:hypothetical protein n=1 Tax=unclassified Lactonifactor TaxID=2636670 RepID=UPI0012AF912A|nr:MULTISPECIES: hypothetical protein [unclassified Lactonifactor]MSA03953.1 hypothetical protein [Lactonifactor sp. BIOML-A5]MSA10428.1 hypothetical protein [Lactonifactor sp. BIOML-A4]MSA14886.1 hypothetical protein [Lactonifactor sp. BIOML-A3]MSA19430.1 hypothetical protein [Lactonifactor sp. BIOML-A2]MSA40010.1 hypothetical protein [Lactonifactor sp. BIOML-A1]